MGVTHHYIEVFFMQVGIIGLKQSGKTTLFRALASVEDRGIGIAAVHVPDDRVSVLSKVFNPKKITYPQIVFKDIEISVEDDGSFHASTVQQMREIDAAAVVLRTFENDSVPHPSITIDPVRDLKEIEDEIFLTDLLQIERRLDRLEREQKRGREYELLKRLGKGLEEGTSVGLQTLNDDEKKLILGFRFLSAKHVLVVINADENNSYPEESVVSYCKNRGYEYIKIYGKIEEEIGTLCHEEQKEFLEDIGLNESVMARFVNRCYTMLDLISFFTVGEDEVKAWNIRRGSTAREAAERIHTDIAKGFIRAETVRYEDFIEAGSFKALKERGILRLEAKEYTVQDGEIMHFRFNL